jgi:soluble lytic murein transglycosylase-like protein
MRSPTGDPRRRPRMGFLIRGNTIWLSELVALTIVGVLLISLVSTTIAIFLNYFTIRDHDVSIAGLRKEQINLDDAVGSVMREVRIITLLRALSGPNVHDPALCRVAETVSRSSTQYGYDPLLLLAVIRVESVFNTGAKGRFISGAESGAFGLMQLQLETAKTIGNLLGMHSITQKDLFNPEINLMLGVAFLTQLIAQFKSFKLGVSAYNQGPGAVYHILSAHEPLSLDYYRNVLKNYYDLKKLAAKIEN